MLWLNDTSYCRGAWTWTSE